VKPEPDNSPRPGLDLADIRSKLDGVRGRQYWRSLEEVAATPEFQEMFHREFPDSASEWGDGLSRRYFLKIAAASLALAGLTGCTRQPNHEILPYIRQPEELVPGESLRYATSMMLDGYATGVLVKSREGHPIKVDGNPEHPASLGGMFMCYITYRHAYPQAFAEAARQTVVLYGTVNTAILLTSSLTMALAVHAAKENNIRWVVRCLLITVLFGLVFLGVKAVEYHDDLKEQLWPGPNFRPDLPAQSQIFWVLYWIMTGIHAFHVTAGVVVLSVIAWMAARGKFSDAYHTPVEISGLYWHFVDIIWIYLYPLLYLVHRYSS
jgi:cytochrome c oxidase subunit 3